MQSFVFDGIDGADMLWKLDNVIACKDYLSEVTDLDTRDRIARLFDVYEKEIMPKLPDLRKAVIHNDANEQNLIVAPTEPDKIYGLIDFGEVQYGSQVNELAVALAYGLLGEDDFEMGANNIIEGYVDEFPLEKRELEMHYYLMAMRLVINITMTSHSAKQQPNNNYILVSQAAARVLLKRLEDEGYILTEGRI